MNPWLRQFYTLLYSAAYRSINSDLVILEKRFDLNNHISFKKIACLVFSLASAAIAGFAQFPGNSSFGNNNRTSTFEGRDDPSRDTLEKEVYSYQIENIHERRLFADSSMRVFHLYDPVRLAKYEYVHLGNLGSAHRPLVFQPGFQQGFDAGFHAYDLYLTQLDSVRFYELEKIYSDIYFTSRNQERTSFQARFAKPLQQRLYLSLDYKNIRNTGNYTHQAARTNAIVGSLNWRSKTGRYYGFVTALANTVEQKENGGGVVSSSDFSKNIIAPGRPVQTSSGEARYFQRDLSYTHFFDLGKKPLANEKTDTAGVTAKDFSSGFSSVNSQNHTASETENLPIKERKFMLKHQFILRKNTYKYTDERGSSSGYYADFWQDDRGVRQFFTTNQVINTFSLHTYRLERDVTIALTGEKISKLATRRDLVEAGITHTFTRLNQEPLDSSLNNLFLFGKIEFTPSPRWQIKTYGHLGMLRQVGDYYLRGDFQLDLKKAGVLNFSLVNQLYSPSLKARQIFITENSIWQNDFKKTFSNTLSAGYFIQPLRLQLTGHYHLLDNFIYFDTNARPQQTTEALNILQLMASQQLDVGRFHFKNTVYWQRATQDVIRFPEWYSIHRLYLDVKLFKVMETEIGGDIRLNSPFYADNFQPLFAQFFQQNDYQTKWYPLADVWLRFRIDAFRFFIKMENLYDFVAADFHYPTYPYPQPDTQLRFGFRWLFLD